MVRIFLPSGVLIHHTTLPFLKNRQRREDLREHCNTRTWEIITVLNCISLPSERPFTSRFFFIDGQLVKITIHYNFFPMGSNPRFETKKCTSIKLLLFSDYLFLRGSDGQSPFKYSAPLVTDCEDDNNWSQQKIIIIYVVYYITRKQMSIDWKSVYRQFACTAHGTILVSAHFLWVNRFVSRQVGFFVGGDKNCTMSRGSAHNCTNWRSSGQLTFDSRQSYSKEIWCDGL